MSSKKKNILNIGFLVLLLVLTFWLVFRDQDLGPIVEILGKVPIHFYYHRARTRCMLCMWRIGDH